MYEIRLKQVESLLMSTDEN